MSAGGAVTLADLTVCRSLEDCAPKFAQAVRDTIDDCHLHGLDAMVFETVRSNDLAKIYFKRGRPPTDEYPTPVTNAPDASWSWHGYGLACDIISQSREWSAGVDWFRRMGAIAKRHGLDWGGDWPHPDYPHVQFGTLRPSPSTVGRTLYAQGQIEEVWRIVGAI